MKTPLKFKLIKNLAEAQEAWNKFSPNQSIYDSWDFRYAYYKYFNFPLYFYAAYYKDELIGLLPLMWNPLIKRLDFFAGFSYMEDNRIFTKPGFEFVQPLLLKQVHKKAKLEYMIGDKLSLPEAKIEDFNYYVDLKSMKSLEDFMVHHFAPKKMRKVLSEIEEIHKNKVEFTYDQFEDLPLLFMWNKLRFGANSSFNERPFWEDFFRDITAQFDSSLITITINGKKVGVGLVIYYNNICFGINTGYNPEINNLGKYIYLLKIEMAIKKGAVLFDAGSGAFGWKEYFHLLKKPQYFLNHNPKQASYAVFKI